MVYDIVLPTLNQWILGTQPDCHTSDLCKEVWHSYCRSWIIGVRLIDIDSIKSCSFIFQYVDHIDSSIYSKRWRDAMGFRFASVGLPRLPESFWRPNASTNWWQPLKPLGRLFWVSAESTMDQPWAFDVFFPPLPRISILVPRNGTLNWTVIVNDN